MKWRASDMLHDGWRASGMRHIHKAYHTWQKFIGPTGPHLNLFYSPQGIPL